MTDQQANGDVSANNNLGERTEVVAGELPSRSGLLKELFIARTQTLYHIERKRFFSFWAKCLTFITLVATSSAVVTYVGGPTSELVKVFGVASVVLFAIELLTSPAVAAGEHAVLARRYLFLEQGIISRLSEAVLEDEAARSALQATISERLDIEVDEPPQKRWLAVWSHNQIVVSQNKGKIYKIGGLQAFLKNWIDLSSPSNVSVVRSLPE